MPILKKTTAANFHGVPVSGFPLILDDDFSVDWLSLNWFLEIYAEGAALTTLGTYAQHLTDFLSQLSVDGMSFQDVHDAWIAVYRNCLIERGNTQSYASQVLRTVLSYLYWLETEGYVYNLVGQGRAFRVRVKLSDAGVMSHPAMKVSSSVKANRPTPRIEWIDKIKLFGPKSEHLAARFELMVDWGSAMGLRAHEITNLKINSLPSLDTALNAIDGSYDLAITLKVTKGSKPRTIPVSPLLIKNTWEFIFTEREQVVSKWKRRAVKKREVYKDSGFVFLSDTTGESLCPRSLSNQVRSAWKEAVAAEMLTSDEPVWTHGLRHCSLKTTHDHLFLAGVERAESVVRQVAGHSSEGAIDTYIGVDVYSRGWDG
ncbi:site-specific integrase [uncultured Pseudoteredinibacter sp.]|uniref:tyrosine-type recombinase/integrase n=1 Tax=uncultured Pseudoteredinibacter sp. TaxID=1641701 RepID=UPI0026103FA3|nr:site-specific integrase [uncultured Pseudoteredinibacter sp.]